MCPCHFKVPQKISYIFMWRGGGGGRNPWHLPMWWVGKKIKKKGGRFPLEKKFERLRRCPRKDEKISEEAAKTGREKA